MHELKLTASVTYDDGQQTPIVLSIAERFRTITTERANVSTMLALTSGAGSAITLGGASGLGGTLLLVNLDPTNFVTIYNATGDRAVARLDPDTDQDGNGGFLLIDRLGADMLVPYAKADTNNCRIAIFSCPP